MGDGNYSHLLHNMAGAMLQIDFSSISHNTPCVPSYFDRIKCNWHFLCTRFTVLKGNVIRVTAHSPFSGSGGATVASGNPRFQNEAICDNTSTTGVMGADSQWSSVSLGIYHDCVNRRHRLEIILQNFSIAHTFYSHTFGWYFDAWLFWFTSWIADWMMMSLRPRPHLVTKRMPMYLM